MAFFKSAIDVLQPLVIELGAGLGVWGVINLLEGYTVIIWDTCQKGWNSSQITPSPEELRDILLDSCDEYLTCKIIDECKREDLTEQEKQKIEAVCRDLLERCQ